MAAETPAVRAARLRSVSPPGTVPPPLAAALGPKLAAMAPVIDAAWLVRAGSGDGEPGLLLVLVGVPEAARDGVAAAVAEAVRFAPGGPGLDLVFLAPDAPALARVQRTGARLAIPAPPPPPSAPGRTPRVRPICAAAGADRPDRRSGRRQVARRPLRLELGRERREPALGDRGAQPGHQLLVVVQVVPGQQHRGDDLAGLEDVVQVGPAVARGRPGSRSPGSSGRGSSACRAFLRLTAPRRVSACPVRPERVGSTQSNMSTPRSTAPTMSSGLPTPIR